MSYVYACGLLRARRKYFSTTARGNSHRHIPGTGFAINLARKIIFRAKSFAMARDVCGLQAKGRPRVSACNPGGGKKQSSAQSLASVADPPLPKRISFPPRRMRSRMAMAAFPICIGFLASRLPYAESASSFATFMGESNWATSRHHRRRSTAFLLTEKWVEKSSFADVMTQFTALEKNVHRLPQRVVKHLDEFLLNKRVGGLAKETVYEPSWPGSAKVIAPFFSRHVEGGPTSTSPSGGPNPLRYRRVEQSPRARAGKESINRALATRVSLR